MITRRTFHRSDFFWLGLIVATFALQFVLPDFRAEIATDSFQTGVRGKKAIYLLAGELEYDTSRSFSPLDTLLRRRAGRESETVLLLLGPARVPTDSEWESLGGFV